MGGLIFLVLLTSGFSTFYLAMDVQRDTINTQKIISDSIMEKTKEKFSISVSTDQDNNNELGIQVKNLGTNPVELADIWIVNKSGSFPAKKFEVDYNDAFVPAGYGTNILESKSLFMTTDEYDIKVVSTLGTIEKSELSVGGFKNLRAQLFAIPPDVRINENVTVTMHVENIGQSSLLNVTPETPTITPALTSTLPPDPAAVNLDPGESIFFTWQYKVTGPSAGTVVTFSSSSNATEVGTGYNVFSNTASDKITAREPEESEIIVLTQDLFARPEIFVVLPGPMGTSPDEKGLWGANIVNPTPSPMTVSRFTITLLSPRENNSDLMFNPTFAPSAKCDPEAVGITSTADWACLTQNQLSWTNLASPIIIPPKSAAQFTVKVHADRLSSSGVEIASVIVVADVFTNLGEFSKAGYSTSFDDGGTVIANVFLSSEKWSIENDDIITTHLGIQSNSLVQFNATLADFEHKDSVIESGSKFVINIPKGWVIEDPPNDIDAFGDFTTTYTTFSDTSSQIVGTLVADYDGHSYGTPLDGVTIEFTARAPTVTSVKMYVMYILAEGQVDAGDFSMGPLSEVVLQVIP